MAETFFFDTYAFLEIIRGNPKYEKYKGAEAMTTVFNLAELAYVLKKEIAEKHADSYVDAYAPFLVEVLPEDIKLATTMKIKNKDLSLPDVIGFLIAKRRQVKFLTGDSAFEHLPNVEFVRK